MDRIGNLFVDESFLAWNGAMAQSGNAKAGAPSTGLQQILHPLKNILARLATPIMERRAVGLFSYAVSNGQRQG